MTHENLTPRDAINYSINRMPEPIIDGLRGGSASSRSVPGYDSSRTVDEIQAQRIVDEVKSKSYSAKSKWSKEQVDKNAGLSDEERLSQAAKILNRELSQEQKDAVIGTHKISEGEMGKDDKPVKIGEYTQAQIKRKANSLKKAGFNLEERRALLESGIAGLPLERFAAINPDTYTDPEIKNKTGFVKTMGTEGNADSEFLQNQLFELNSRIDRGTGDLREARTFRDQIQDLLTEARRQETAELEERRRAAEARSPTERRGGYEHLERTEEQLRAMTPEERQNWRDQIKQAIREAPAIDASRFPEQLLVIALSDKELREMLLNRILFKPYEDTTEANMYRLNFYAEGNRDDILGKLAEITDGKYDYFKKLQTAVELFHAMNVSTVSGDIEHLLDYARRINFEHFSLMQELPGLPDVMRLYEEKYQEILAREGRIATEGYKTLKKEVERAFNEMNEKGIVRSEYETERTGDRPWIMEDWERTRAINAGRAFFNITIRAAEHIANGQLESGGRKWTGFPQEDAVRLMNWPKWLVERFEVAIPRGGRAFLDRTSRNYFEFLVERKRKLGINRIAQLGGMRVDELELGAMFGVSGVYSSWRLEAMLFPKIKLANGQTLRDWLDEEVGYISPDGKTIMARGKDRQSHWVDKGISLQKRADWLDQIQGDIKSQDQLLKFLSPVIENTDIALGVLLKQGLTSGEVGYKVRERIWQRVAETNLPLMINYLSSISEMDDPIEVGIGEPLKGAPKAQNRIRPDDWTCGEEGSEERKEGDRKWNEFKENVLLHHAWEVKRAAGANVSEESPVRDYIRDHQDLIDKIKQEGRALAPQLADIVFPYVPFMNDVPFELIDYAGPGETFYKRRLGSDLPSFSAAERAFTTIVNNPGGIGAENALKAFDEIVKGIESPQGTPDAQERVYPMLSAWGEFVLARPGHRQMIIKEFAGMDAESLDENQMLAVLGNATKAGIISHDLYNEMKKKKHLGILFILWALFRDIIIMAPAIAAWEMGKDTMKKAA